jgi:6-pyruvoyltetrahydropterin/6-carboxytetrahydropterin synthase
VTGVQTCAPPIYFGIVKKHVREIMGRLDHTYLNESEMFSKTPPSSENIALYVAEEVQKNLDVPGVRVSRVKVWESDDACATYIVD